MKQTIMGERFTAENTTFVVCSNRLHLVGQYLPVNIGRLAGLKARYLVIYDGDLKSDSKNLIARLLNLNVSVHIMGANVGLSKCRNIALNLCTTDLIVFMDDEITVDRDSMIQLVRTLSVVEGAGVYVDGPESPIYFPWFITRGQLHYLGIHNGEKYTRSPWGACFGFQMPQILRWELSFREDLGRRGKKLECGDDTTFCAEIVRRGGVVEFLSEAKVWHNILPNRVSFRYILKRAFWQGRSEIRRKSLRAGLKKEWRRQAGDRPVISRRGLLAILYTTFVLLGGVYEGIYR